MLHGKKHEAADLLHTLTSLHSKEIHRALIHASHVNPQVFVALFQAALSDKETFINVTVFESEMQEWQKLARAGQKIEAIKEHRAITGLGLKESKDEVEAWLRDHC